MAVSAKAEWCAQAYLIAGSTPFDVLVLALRSAIAEKRAEKWRTKAIASLDSAVVGRGILGIFRDVVDVANMFVALLDEGQGKLYVVGEYVEPHGGRCIDMSEELEAALQERDVTLRTQNGAAPLSNFGARTDDCGQIVVIGILSIDGRCLGMLGFEHQHNAEVPVCSRKLMRDVAVSAGIALSAIEVARRMAQNHVEWIRLIHREFAHWINSPLQVWAYLLDAIEKDAQDLGLTRSPQFDAHMSDLRQVWTELRAIGTKMRGYEEDIAVELAELDLSETIESVCHEYAPLVKEEHIDLQCVIPNGVVMLGDKERVRYLARCLLDNARDAIVSKRESLGEGAAGSISVSLAMNAPVSRACLRIADDGAGIPTSMQKQVFLPLFTTKEDLSERHGIGLFSARQIALKHNGDLGLEHSEVRGGSTFLLTLPILRYEKTR